MFYIVTLTLKQIFKSKKMFVIFILLFLSLILGIYSIKHGKNGIIVFSDLVYLIYLKFFVLLITLIFAASLINDEIRTGEIAFLTTRVSRTKILMEKYTGYLIATSLIFMIPLAVTFITMDIYAPQEIPIQILSSYTVVIFLAIAVYGSFYLFISLIISRPLMFGLFFAFVWEMIAPNISQRVSRATIINYLQSISYKLIKYGRIQDINSSEFGYSVVILLCIWIITLLLSIIIFKQKSIE